MNKEELNELEKICNIFDENYLVLCQVASYLNNAPDSLTKEIMEEITGGDKQFEEYSYAMFLANVFTEDEKLANDLLKKYYLKSVKRLNEQEYYQNPYYKNIKIPNKTIDKWTLGYQKYKSYEAFIRDDLIIDGYREIPSIGYFDKTFSFPTVFENGVEWMAIKPNEIETMKQSIKEAKGNVLVYGLGLGYYAYMISLKNEVSNITIIERDESVIKLFNEYILSQFENKDKIRIIQCDAFEYAEKVAKNHTYTYVFVDLWHDVSDGTEMYMKMKKLEKHLSNATFSYWIEKSILSTIRPQIFDTLYTNIKENKLQKSLEEIKHMLTDDFLKELIKG